MKPTNESSDDEHEPMMQKRVRDLETGMTLAKPVYSEDGCTLLQEGNVLDSRDIDRLLGWNKRYVYVRAPDTDDQQPDSLPQAS